MHSPLLCIVIYTQTEVDLLTQRHFHDDIHSRGLRLAQTEATLTGTCHKTRKSQNTQLPTRRRQFILHFQHNALAYVF